MNTEENPLVDLMLAVGLALAVVAIVMQVSLGLTRHVEWGVPIELGIIVLATGLRAAVAAIRGHLYRTLAWGIATAAAIMVPTFAHACGYI